MEKSFRVVRLSMLFNTGGMAFITDDFMLQSERARRLYHDVAKDLPIIDYHCHLPPQDIAEDRQYDNIHAIWLQGDHYKWRALRTNGVPEELITGDADPYDKFLAWAKTVPKTLRNPLYHWTHLELKRYFGIDQLLNENTADAIWHETKEKLADPSMSARNILKRFRVSVIGTTDDPVDDLPHHRAIAEAGVATRVYPSYRPDKGMKVADPKAFRAYVEALGTTAGCDTSTLAGFVEALKARHNDFHELGARLSDHGMDRCPDIPCTETEAGQIFNKAMGGEVPSAEEAEAFQTYMMDLFGEWDAQKGWTKQLHLGPLRNNRTVLFEQAGPDSGGDSMGDWLQAEPLSHYLDRLDRRGSLPKTIVYNLNPRDNYLFATMMGNFQDGKIPGKMQFGSGWWFLDQEEGMRWQINALSNLGLLSYFVGMLTDSRSFLSFCRHEYFRRILCQMIGEDMDAGKIPDDFEMVAQLVRDVCYGNASRYFGFQLGEV